MLALPAGQGVAFTVRGNGFVWPGPRLGESLVGLVCGDPGRGLPTERRVVVPPGGLIYAAVVVLEVALAAVAFVGFVGWWRTIGPLAQVGMAAKREVAVVLGRRQLMRRRRTIRPDLVSGGRR